MYTSRQLGRTAGPPAHEPAFLYAPLSATPTGTSGAITPNNPWARFNQTGPMAVTAQKKAITNHAKGSSGSPSEAPNEWSLASAGYGPMGGGIIKTKRLLTLAFDDKEAVWSLPETFAVSQLIWSRVFVALITSLFTNRATRFSSSRRPASISRVSPPPCR